jgi:hypothetical protein
MKKSFILLLTILFSVSLFADNIIKDNFYYSIDTITNTATIVDYDDSGLNILGNIIIQREIVYNNKIYQITSIGDNAFDCCHNIQSITIPRYITKIGKRAFYACSNLHNIIYNSSELVSLGESALDETLWLENQPDGCVYFGKCLYKYKGEMPENTSIEVIDGTMSICCFAFQQCKNLVNITLPNTLRLIDRYAFAGCGFSSISIPNSVDSIGIMAFSSCLSLTNVELSTSLKVLKNYVFNHCSALSSIDLSHITKIENGAFAFCSELNSVTFNEKLSIINKFTFMNCKNLKRVTFPASLDSIGENAFYGCSGIEYMEVQATTPPRIHKNTFDSVNRNIEFIVPAEAYNAYATHEYWKVFMGEDKTFNEHITYESQNIYYSSHDRTLYFNINNPTSVIIYDTMGKTILNSTIASTTKQLSINLNNGIYIVNIITENQSTIQTKIIVK